MSTMDTCDQAAATLLYVSRYLSRPISLTYVPLLHEAGESHLPPRVSETAGALGARALPEENTQAHEVLPQHDEKSGT